MADLPDYYTQTSIAEAEAARFKGGGIAARPLVPVSRDIYYATDEKILYICVVDGVWTGFDASILVQGILTLYANMDANSKKIINLAAPTLANDATRKAYVDALVGGDVAAHAALTTGIHGVGASTIASILDIVTHAALDTGVHGAGANTLIHSADTIAALAAVAADYSMSNHKLKDLAAPTLANDATRKAYVDAHPGSAAFDNHSARHEDTGADEIDVTGLAGLLADSQTPLAHKNSHHPIDGSDKLDTAIPVKVGAANAIGSSHSFSRADHVHEREHAKYTDAAAKAAAVQVGAITNAVTKAPTHDAVYDVKVMVESHSARHEDTGADELDVTGLAGLLADDQHVLDAEAKAAAVQAGAITNGVTKAPTHDAVYDVKVTADAALPAVDKYTNAEAVAAAEAAGLDLALGKDIKLISALTADHSWTGLTAVMTAGTALLFGQACRIGSDSKLEKGNVASAATMPAMCVALASIAENAAGEVLLQGFIRDNTWNFTPGGLLYVAGAAGLVSQIIPTDPGEQVQVIGVALTADIIYFSPSFELVAVS